MSVNRIQDGEDFRGTYMVYGADPTGHVVFACDVEVKTMDESRYEELRAHRLRRLASGKKAKEIRDDQLSNELLVVFGPELSATAAVDTLLKLVKHIQKKGLIVGRGKDGFVREIYKLRGGANKCRSFQQKVLIQI